MSQFSPMKDNSRMSDGRTRRRSSLSIVFAKPGRYMSRASAILPFQGECLSNNEATQRPKIGNMVWPRMWPFLNFQAKQTKHFPLRLNPVCNAFSVLQLKKLWLRQHSNAKIHRPHSVGRAAKREPEFQFWSFPLLRRNIQRVLT